VWLGDRLELWLSDGWIDWLLAGSFMAMGLWVLIPD
jgi:putative Ca2+/H+ antiporter (TMEM165/GDT1 family)